MHLYLHVQSEGFSLQDRRSTQSRPVRHIVFHNLSLFGAILQSLNIDSRRRPGFFPGCRSGLLGSRSVSSVFFVLFPVNLLGSRFPDILIRRQIRLFVSGRKLILAHQHLLINVDHVAGASLSQLHALI